MRWTCLLLLVLIAALSAAAEVVLDLPLNDGDGRIAEATEREVKATGINWLQGPFGTAAQELGPSDYTEMRQWLADYIEKLAQ